MNAQITRKQRSNKLTAAGLAGLTLFAAVAVFLVTFQWHQGASHSTRGSEGSEARVAGNGENFGNLPTLRPNPAGEPGDTLPGLRSRTSGGGRVRLIVELRIENEPGVKGIDGVQAFRESIASSQQSVGAILPESAETIATLQSLPLMIVEVDEDGLEKLLSSEHVVRIVEDRKESLHVTQTVPMIGASELIGQGIDGHGWAIAILDTGVEATHPFLGGRVVAEACFSSNIPGSTTSLCPNGASEQFGPGAASFCPTYIKGCDHGTHVAGIAAGLSAIDSGVAPGANIIAVQVFSEDFEECAPGESSCLTAWASDTIRALEWVYSISGDYNIAAVNMSLGGGPGYSDQSTCDAENSMRKGAIDQLLSVGIVTVASAGNRGLQGAMSAPGCISSAISVGATDFEDNVADISNSAPFLSLLAPGVDIDSSIQNGRYGLKTGTSMAAPHVAGAIALLRSAMPEATGMHVVNTLRGTGKPITDHRTGITTPRIDVMEAYVALTTAQDEPAPAPSPELDDQPAPSNPNPAPAPSNRPLNDDWQDAIDITTSWFYDFVDTTYATTQADEPYITTNYWCPFGGETNNSVWYVFTAPTDGWLSINTWGSSYDTIIAVYDDSPDYWNQLGCADDNYYPYDLSTTISGEIEAGTTIWIQVSAWDQGGLLSFQLAFWGY